MFRFWPFHLAAPFRRRRPRFEASVLREMDYLTGAFGPAAQARGIERAARDYISSRRREVIAEAVRRLGEKDKAASAPVTSAPKP